MSHSWYDDPNAKIAMLSNLANNFQREKGRFPTFWLDKVCIDQNKIKDGLKVLPINVMACKKMLVLCGHTYASRLWCAWELFTLFSFQGHKRALEQIEVGCGLRVVGAVAVTRGLRLVVVRTHAQI